jgi:hypothetical protein
MRVEREVIEGRSCPYTLEELWGFRKELKETFGDDLEWALTRFAERFCADPQSVHEEDRDVACKIFYMMKLIPQEPNQN